MERSMGEQPQEKDNGERGSKPNQGYGKKGRKEREIVSSKRRAP
jgi:hypothetical protein